jgi:cytochrome b subunit of formate dehydrogenase
MLSNCAYHLAYLFTRLVIQKRYSALSMVPQPKDALQGLQMVRYFLGLRKEKPAFDRFSYVEKFDYWAPFWGIAMMGGSGLVCCSPYRSPTCCRERSSSGAHDS